MKLENEADSAAVRPVDKKVLRLCLAWAFVGFPLAWGVSRTVSSSIPLFADAPPPQAVTAPSKP